MLIPDLVSNLISNGTQMRRAAACEDDKKVRNGRDVPEIENHRAFGFAVVRIGAAQLSEFLGIHDANKAAKLPKDYSYR